MEATSNLSDSGAVFAWALALGAAKNAARASPLRLNERASFTITAASQSIYLKPEAARMDRALTAQFFSAACKRWPGELIRHRKTSRSPTGATSMVVAWQARAGAIISSVLALDKTRV